MSDQYVELFSLLSLPVDSLPNYSPDTFAKKLRSPLTRRPNVSYSNSTLLAKRCIEPSVIPPQKKTNDKA